MNKQEDVLTVADNDTDQLECAQCYIAWVESLAWQSAPRS